MKKENDNNIQIDNATRQNTNNTIKKMIPNIAPNATKNSTSSTDNAIKNATIGADQDAPTPTECADEITTVAKKKSRFGALRAAVVALIAFTLLCGVIYPVSVTLVAQAMFPYEANGSVITVTLADGNKKVFGSELIGQQFSDGKYLLGRINLGAPSNLAPNSDEFKKLVEERKAFLNTLGHTDNIPSELVTSSGSGVDPHITPETAKYQIDRIVQFRNATLSEEEKLTAESVEKTIEKYTEGRFLGIFGEKTVNVLLVNLALDGLL